MDDPDKTPSETARPFLHQAAPWSFLLLVAVLPWTIAPMGITAALCAAASIAVWLTRGGSGIPHSPVNRAAVIWAGALLAAALFSLEVGGSLPRLKKALLPGLVLLAAGWGAHERIGRRAVGVLLLSSLVASVWGLTQVLGREIDFGHRASGPVGHYMTFAGQLLLFVSLAAGISLVARRLRWRIAAALTAAVGTAALFGTFTRSAWLGLVVSLAVMLGRWRARWLATLVVIVGLLVALAPSSYRQRLTSAFDPSHVTNVERTYMWRAGWRMFLDHPLTGVGLQDLHPLYERYRDPRAVEGAGHLHSVPFHIAASMGLLGLAAFAVLFLSLLWCAWEGLGAQLRRGGLAAGLRLGVLGAMTGFLVAGLFEWNFGDEEVIYPLYTLAGLAWAARRWDGASTDTGA